MIDILIPTYKRAAKLQRVVDNIREVSGTPHRILFIYETDDEESKDAALACGADAALNPWEPSFSNALQTGYEVTKNPFFLPANDDFDFQQGWDIAALDAMADPAVQVVGIADGAGSCTAITLIRRSYIETQSGVIDMPNRVFYPYNHNYVDTEFAATAKARGVLKEVPESVIVHMHPCWGLSDFDATYTKNQQTMSADGATFNSRAYLWAT